MARQTAFRRQALQLIENKAVSSQEFYRELARSDDDGKWVAARGLGLATSAEASLNIPLLRELLQSGKTTEIRLRAYVSLLNLGAKPGRLSELSLPKSLRSVGVFDYCDETLQPILLELSRVSDPSKLQELRADLELLSQNPQLPDSIRERARKLLSGN